MKPALCNRDTNLYVTDCTPLADGVRGGLEGGARLEGFDKQNKRQTKNAS